MATNDFLPDLKKYAKYLGPKKLMPNIKDNTLLEEKNIINAIERLIQGSVNFKIDRDACIKAAIGKVSFED